jgi:hypothetical protein
MPKLRKCERCGAQAAGYMDIDFRCEKKQCPLRNLLDSKATMIKFAYQGSEGESAQRKATQIMLDLMRIGFENDMTFEQVQQTALMIANEGKEKKDAEI